MNKLKSHKTVEQIAKKHRLEPSFIQKQLDMGEPIEHEHTKDHDLARDIALQHLDEIPDYYTRLKKMEASAKKEHKKFKDIKESKSKIKYCPLCKKNERKSECSYGGDSWDKYSIDMKEKFDFTNQILNNLKESKKKGLWDNIHAKRKRGEKPAKPGDEGYPKTLNVEEKDLEEGIKQARKNVGASKCWTGKKLGTPPTKIKGGKEVPNCVPANEEVEIEEAIRLPATNGNIISVILSWRGKTYMTKMFFPQTTKPSKKEVTDQIQKVYPTAVVLQYNISGLEPGQPLIQVYDPKRSKNYLLNNGTIGEETSVLDKPPTKEEKRKIKKMQELERLKKIVKASRYQSDVAKEEFEIEESTPAWQRKEGKNQSGGLNEKGRKSYERENPGSDLKAPSKKVGNPRRASFCARMKGMKNKLTSAKTARDPNSRINKSLRAWNC